MRTVVTTIVCELLPWISIGPLLLTGLMITLIRGSAAQHTARRYIALKLREDPQPATRPLAA